MDLLQLLTISNFTCLLNGVDLYRLRRVSHPFYQLITHDVEFDRTIWKSLCNRHDILFAFHPKRIGLSKRKTTQGKTKASDSPLPNEEDHSQAYFMKRIKLLESKHNTWVFADLHFATLGGQTEGVTMIRYRKAYIHHARTFERYFLDRALNKLVAALECRGIDLKKEEKQEDESLIDSVLNLECIEEYCTRYPGLRGYLPLPQSKGVLHYHDEGRGDEEESDSEESKDHDPYWFWNLYSCKARSASLEVNQIYRFDGGCSSTAELLVDKFGFICYETMVLDWAEWITNYPDLEPWMETPLDERFHLFCFWDELVYDDERKSWEERRLGRFGQWAEESTGSDGDSDDSDDE
ncbi:hypothetical protein PROFUN_14426 [Planoprotostelium fungivorum]|uniref:F-box domain-containing protein n=1 Tax=Planoprotostelium fungivorum TaxID=1890364 RepID=A0A2P6N088_9EUKA|nr:hypothetical protein PROFUN_14426 [Planoprotostelium fungivorum]